MKKGIVAIAVAAVIVLAGCAAENNVITGGVDTVTEAMSEVPVDEELIVEVTGYILEDDPARAAYGSDEYHSTVPIFQDAKAVDSGYISAMFRETPDELNELIESNTSMPGMQRVTIVGTSSGGDYGEVFSVIRDCEIKFD